MSDDREFRWIETYFIMFPSARRPSLAEVQQALEQIGDHFQIGSPLADNGGAFESITLTAHDQGVAVEVSYDQGEEVSAQAIDWAKQMQHEAESSQLQQLMTADARLDVMHFEEVRTAPAEGEFDDLTDPGTLLLAIDALVELTGGLPVDPSTGAIMP